MSFCRPAVLMLIACLGTAQAAAKGVTHFPPPPIPGMPPGFVAPLSQSVLVGKTLYVSGAISAAGKAGGVEGETKAALDGLKGAVEKAGMTMDDFVWIQVMCTDLTWYGKFNEIYRTYFKGPLPARAFLGTSQLLAGSHFEIMGIAVKP